MTRSRSTLSPSEVSSRNVEMAARSHVSKQDKEQARELHILGGIYPAEAEELAAAARMVKRIAPADAEVMLDVLGLAQAS